MAIKYNPLADPCLSCGLWRDKKHPCIRPREYKKGGLVFIGEAPGENEDKAGDAFVGRAGEILRSILSRLNIRDYTLLNAVGCRPTDGYGRNRTPSVKEVELCNAFLLDDIRLLEPTKLICLGRIAAKALKLEDKIGDLRHKKYLTNCYPEYGQEGVDTYVTYHPAAGLRPGKANLIQELENDLKEYLGVPENRTLTSVAKHGILSIDGEERDSICIDIETSGFFKDHDAFPFDQRGEILLIGTDKGNVVK